MKHMQLSQKNIARGRDRSGASGPWITITRPRVNRICTCEGICGCAGEERETLCACSPIRYTRNGYCTCFWTPHASLVCYQWSGPNHFHTFFKLETIIRQLSSSLDFNDTINIYKLENILYRLDGLHQTARYFLLA